MADLPDRELPPAKRRRLIFRAVLRGVLVTVALVVLYYLLPLDRPWDSDTAVRLLIGLLVFVGVTVWHVRAITGARFPGPAGGRDTGIHRSLLPAAVRLDVLPDGTSLRGELHPEMLTRTDALYFSVTVFTTVGFGDIAAKSETARVVLIVQMLADLALLGAVAQSACCWGAALAQQRRTGTGDGPGPPSGPPSASLERVSPTAGTGS